MKQLNNYLKITALMAGIFLKLVVCLQKNTLCSKIQMYDIVVYAE